MKQILLVTTILALPLGMAQAQSWPPTRPWATHFDGYTYMQQVNLPLENISLNSHIFFINKWVRFSRYQEHETGLQIVESEFPANERLHSVSLYMTGVNVYHNIVPDGNGGEKWDGTWVEQCGPNSNRKLPCRSGLVIEFQSDITGANEFTLYAPWAIPFDADADSGSSTNGWHHIIIGVDTAACAEISVANCTEFILDDVPRTADYNGDQDTGDNYFRFSDNGTYQGPMYFETDNMYWRWFNDNVENIYPPGHYDNTCPTGDVAEVWMTMNPADETKLYTDYLINNDIFSAEDQRGIPRPEYLGFPYGNVPFGYIPEISFQGNSSTFYYSTGGTAWQVQGYGSGEIWSQGYLGGQLFDSFTDPMP